MIIHVSPHDRNREYVGYAHKNLTETAEKRLLGGQYVSVVRTRCVCICEHIVFLLCAQKKYNVGELIKVNKGNVIRKTAVVFPPKILCPTKIAVMFYCRKVCLRINLSFSNTNLHLLLFHHLFPSIIRPSADFSIRLSGNLKIEIKESTGLADILWIIYAH